MGRPDMTRDYYADLELPATADVNDVKKQFRKLALKYHPDRNPGKEAEVNAKFQIIQSAHEILASPDSKSKYDAQRSRGGGPRASGVRGNPWSNPAPNFPPPPRRQPAGTSRTTPSSGQRYASFASSTSGRPQQPKPTTEEEAKSRAQAFESMRPPRRPAPTAASAFKTSATSGASASSGTWATPGASPSSRGRAQERPSYTTASQQQKAEAAFGTKASRFARPGFVPGSPMGDEPPVASKNYNNKRHTSLFDDAPPVPPRRPRQPSNPEDADESDIGAGEAYMDPRQSSPYRVPGGEKLNPFDGVHLGRAKSTREPSRRYDDSDGPFSPRDSRPRSYSVADEGDAEPDTPSREPRRPSAANQTPRMSSNSAYSPAPTSRTGSRHAPSVGRAGFGVPDGGARGSRDDSSTSGASAAATVGEERSRRAETNDHPIHNSFAPTGSRTDNADPKPSDSQHSFMRSSTDNINTRFVAEEHANTNWQFNAGVETSKNATAGRSQSSSRAGRRSPAKGRPTAPNSGLGTAGIGLGFAAAAAAAGAAAAGMSNSYGVPEEPEIASPTVGFDAEGWRHQIGSEHFTPAPSSKPTSPTRGARIAKKRSVRVTRGGSAGLVDDEETTSGEDRNAGANNLPGEPGSPNAMDIDTPTPMAEEPSTRQAAPANGVRPVPVEPFRPEWRAGDANGLGGVPGGSRRGSAATPTRNPAPESATTPGQNNDTTPRAKTGGPPPALPQRSAPANPPAAGRGPQFNFDNTAGSEDTDGLGTGFGDFRNVAPFANIPTGLDSLDGLKANLPFESRAADTNHLQKDQQPLKVNFPKAPSAPRPPPTAAPGLGSLALGSTAWAFYVRDFEAYLLEWDHFNTKFVDHVIARQNSIIKLRKRHGIATLQSGRGDFNIEDYLGWIELDKTVHEMWAVYTSEHLESVRVFKSVRDQQMKSAR